jgi:hypothetical protein
MNRAQRRALAKAERRQATKPQANQRHVDELIQFRVLKTVAAHQSTEPLSMEQARDLALGYHGAMAAFRDGTANAYQANTLSAAANIALLLVEGGLGDDVALVKAGQLAVVSAMGRHAKTGRWGFTGPEMLAVAALLDYHDAQLASPDCTEGLITAALIECKRRIGEGHTLKVAA